MLESMILARGRGIASLIEGLYNGEPAAWGILIGVIAIAAAWYGIKAYLARSAQSSSSAVDQE